MVNSRWGVSSTSLASGGLVQNRGKQRNTDLPASQERDRLPEAPELTCSPETGPGEMIESPLQADDRHEEEASSRGADHPDTAGSRNWDEHSSQRLISATRRLSFLLALTLGAGLPTQSLRRTQLQALQPV